MSETPDFLSESPDSAPEATPAATPETGTPKAEPTPAAPPTGSPTPPPTGEATGETVTDPATGHQVPLATYLDTRDRARGLEAEVRRLQAAQAEREAAERMPPPSRDEDPEGYEAHQAALIDGRMYAMRRDFSRQFAETQHGKQVVDAAFAWGVEQCDRDPHFNGKVRGHPDPVGFVVSEWKREQLLARLSPDELDAFIAWKANQPPAAAAPPAANGRPGAPQPPARPAAPRASLAAAPSAGKSGDAIALDGEATFQKMFGS